MARKLTAALVFIVFASLVTIAGAQTEHAELLRLLQDDGFSEALEHDEIANPETPQLSYWRAVCLAATNQMDAAIAACQELSDRWPDGSHHKQAQRLAEILNQFEGNADSMAKVFHERLGDFRANSEVLLFEFQDQSVQTPAIRFGIDFKNQRCQLCVKHEGKVMAQIETDSKGSRWYLSSNDEIIRFEEQFFPVIDVSVERLSDESFTLDISGSLSTESKEAKATWKQLLESEWFSTKAGCRAFFIETSRRKGIFPVSMVTKKGTTVCRFMKPDFVNGGFSESQYELSKGSMIDKAGDDELRFQTKKAGGELLSDFDWPQVEVVKKEADFLFIQQCYASILALSKKEDEATEDLVEDKIEQGIGESSTPLGQANNTSEQ